jgi:hypothetical protein
VAQDCAHDLAFDPDLNETLSQGPPDPVGDMVASADDLPKVLDRALHRSGIAR